MEEVSKEAKRVNTWKWTQLFPGFFIVGKFSKTTESEKPKEMGASGRSQHKLFFLRNKEPTQANSLLWLLSYLLLSLAFNPFFLSGGAWHLTWVLLFSKKNKKKT